MVYIVSMALLNGSRMNCLTYSFRAKVSHVLIGKKGIRHLKKNGPLCKPLTVDLDLLQWLMIFICSRIKSTTCCWAYFYTICKGLKQNMRNDFPGLTEARLKQESFSIITTSVWPAGWVSIYLTEHWTVTNELCPSFL